MHKGFLEGCHQIAAAFVPVDMQAGANNGDWVNMANYQRVLAVLFKAAGTAGDDPIFKLQQAKDAAGTGAKDLLFTTIYSKVGAALTALGQFTKITQAAATSYTDATSAEAQAIIAVEVLAEQLDSDGGFTHIQLSVADVGGNAQLGCGFYIGCCPTYEVEPSLTMID